MIRTFILATAMTLATATAALFRRTDRRQLEDRKRRDSGHRLLRRRLLHHVEDGKHAGKRIGNMNGSGDSYTGEITDPANDKTYSGSASINGASLKMQGCVLKVLCKSQTWTRM